MKRQEILHSIRQTPQISVLIIGAGINGIGTFRDLALQGLDVLLVDRADFCGGASATSSHMAHGGIRYLENGEFRLVREAVEERNRLIQNAPHYVSPLPTVIPIFKWFSGIFNAPMKFLGLLDKPTERGAAIIKMGLMMYDAYTGKQATVPKHEFYMRKEALKRYPELNPDIVYTAKYYDGLIHAPERLCVELVLDAEEAGSCEVTSVQAKALNYMSVLKAEGNLVYLKDEISGTPLKVEPQIVINATGPWIDFANQALGRKTHFIGGTKGSHLVLDHPALREAIGEHEFFFENDDGRIVLICPLLDKVLVGTSDIAIENPDEAFCSDEEIDYFLSMIPKVFPNLPVERSQIVFTFSGVRPLPASDANTTGQISRDHSIKIIEPALGSHLSFPIYNLIGGKWTTFRAFAEQVTDQVLAHLGRTRQSSTEQLAIGGGKAYPTDEELKEQWVRLQQKWSQRPRSLIEQLFKRYGTRAELVLDYMVKQNGTSDDPPLTHKADYYRQEIAFLTQNEKVLHLDDLILRRSHLAILGQISEPLLNELADIVGDALDWTPEERQKEVERAIAILRERHRVELGNFDYESFTDANL